MSEIMFRDPVKDEMIDEQIRERRAKGDTVDEMAQALNLSKTEVKNRTRRMLRNGRIAMTPRGGMHDIQEGRA